jgi:hypothetical protein
MIRPGGRLMVVASALGTPGNLDERLHPPLEDASLGEVESAAESWRAAIQRAVEGRGDRATGQQRPGPCSRLRCRPPAGHDPWLVHPGQSLVRSRLDMARADVPLRYRRRGADTAQHESQNENPALYPGANRPGRGRMGSAAH